MTHTPDTAVSPDSDAYTRFWEGVVAAASAAGFWPPPDWMTPPPDEVQDEALLSGSLSIDARARRVFVHGKEVHLTRTEYTLLTFLARHHDEAVSVAALAHVVLGIRGVDNSSNPTLRQHVHKLRLKLDDSRIATVHSFGYMLRTS